MDKKSWMICVAATALIVAFISLAPGYFSRVRQEISIMTHDREQDGFQGIISVWHIVGFRPYKGSLGSWMKEQATELEKGYSGVYFEVDSITVEEAENRIARGELPDIYSFPLGWADAEQLLSMKLQSPELKGNLAECGRLEGSLYGQPFALSGYIVAANLRIIQELGVERDNIPKLIRDGSLQAAGDAVVGAVYDAGSLMLSHEEFLEGKAAVALADGRMAGDIARKVQQGKGFPYIGMQYGNYSDLVQLMGISRYISEEKLECAMEFIEVVLEDENQLSLYDLGIIPAVREHGDKIKISDEMIEMMACELEDAAAPNSFLYKRYKDQMYKSASAALEGDIDAKKDFELRMVELVRGEVIK